MATNEEVAADTVATKPEEETAGVVNTSNVVNFDESRSAINIISSSNNDSTQTTNSNEDKEKEQNDKEKEKTDLVLVEAKPTTISNNSKISTLKPTTTLVTTGHTTITNGNGLVKTLSSVVNKKFLLRRRFKDSGGILRNFNSLPLFVYATSPSSHAISADGVGVAKELSTLATITKNEKRNHCHVDDFLAKHSNCNQGKLHLRICGRKTEGDREGEGEGRKDLECPNTLCNCFQQIETMASATTIGSSGGAVGDNGGATTNIVVGTSNNNSSTMIYNHHLTMNTTPTTKTTITTNNHHHNNHLQHLHQQHQQHQQHLLSHQIPYSNNYHPLHHSNSHHNIHSEQTKSLQELQHEVGALLEFRNLVIETFPDLKQKMASMSSSTTISSQSPSTTTNVSTVNGVLSSNPTTISGTTTNSNIRREWEPGIRPKRKGQKDSNAMSANGATGTGAMSGSNVANDICSSLTRSRSNSHSGKKEPKSGENNNGSVIQDSGFSTETSSSKEGHSASSTNGPLAAAQPLTRVSSEADDELLNLLDVIHRKSNRLREEVEHLQNYERHNLQNVNNSHLDIESTATTSQTITARPYNSQQHTTTPTSTTSNSLYKHLTPKSFREHVERLNREDIKQLRKERDRLLEKLAEMEAETLTGRVKAAKMNERVEELKNVKKDLEEQLKLAMAQKFELTCRLQLFHQQQQQLLSAKSSSISSTTATTVLSPSNATLCSPSSSQQEVTLTPLKQKIQTTFQQQQNLQDQKSTNKDKDKDDELLAFHQSVSSDTNPSQHQSQQQTEHNLKLLGHLDGIVSTPGSRNTKSRNVDSKRFSAILLENNVLELKRHLLTLTVHNQVLSSKLDKTSNLNNILFKRLEKQKEEIEDLRFRLEEKNIELEGTKAELRVIESLYPSASSGSTKQPTANSFQQHSHQDYETNRSTASTTLALSRRCGSGLASATGSSSAGIDSTTSSEINASSTPHQTAAISSNVDVASTVNTQISTPSMKAMIPLPMDDLQHHSSTESAQDNEIASNSSGIHGARLMSSSVGRLSPFEQTSKTLTPTQQAIRKFIGNTGSKPSKIPLPGSSKAAAYFAGKPPSGRPTTALSSTSTAGRSPPSANGSYTSNKSLSRSTGNLLYNNKSPNNSTTSLSTNTSRSSTNSSSIPLAVTPYTIASRVYASGSSASNSTTSNCTSSPPVSPTSSAATTTTTTTTPPTPTSTITTIGATTVTTNTHNNNNNNNNNNNPSFRILQNSPLPKLKRETLSSKIKHLDSLSRAHYQQHQQQLQRDMNSSSNDLNTSSNTNANSSHNISNISGSNNSNSSYIISSTPKPSAIAAQINSSLRKELQLSSNSFSAGGGHSIFRRAAANQSSNGNQTFNTSNNSGGGNGSSGSNGLNNFSNTSTTTTATARRFSSASIIGDRVAAAARNHELQIKKQQEQHQHQPQTGTAVNTTDYQGLHQYNHHHSNSGNSGNASNASDSDSGKKLLRVLPKRVTFNLQHKERKDSGPLTSNKITQATSLLKSSRTSKSANASAKPTRTTSANRKHIRILHELKRKDPTPPKSPKIKAKVDLQREKKLKKDPK